MLDLNYNSSWTNATLEDALCNGIISLGGPDVVTRVSIGDSSDPSDDEYGPPLVIPSCFWDLSIVTELQIENAIFIGSNSTVGEGDPLIRLPATLTKLKLYKCVLSNPKVGGTTYKMTNWASFFTSKPLLNYLSLYSMRNFEASLPSTLPSTLSYFYLSHNPKVTGTIPATLFSNYNDLSVDINIDLSYCGLTGPIPATLFTNLKNSVTTL